MHTEQQTNRPTHPTLSSTEPEQEQSQYTWSVALEDTFRVTPSVDIVGGVSYDTYEITKAEEFTAAAGIFEYPKGGSDAINWQAAVFWRHGRSGGVARQRFRPRALPGHLRAVQHALRHGDAEPGSRAGAGDEHRGRLEPRCVGVRARRAPSSTAMSAT